MGTAAPNKRLHAIKVLVVEDDADARESVVEYLTFEGAQVSQASSGTDAYWAFLLMRPSVVVSDLQMPDGDGYDFIRKLRALPAATGGRTSAVAVSSSSNESRALEVGFDEFVPKPLDLSRLTDRLARLAAHK
jgi:CheY-like chemotaxis protein